MGLITNQQKVVQEVSLQNFDAKLATSKLKSLQDHLSAILQKKIRLDLEIKRVRNRISKLKEKQLTQVKASVSLEGFDYDHLNPDLVDLLRERVGEDKIQEITELELVIQEIDKLLETYQNLPLYEEE